MLVIFVPPTELVRFGAGISATADIMVPERVPPEDIKEVWIARNCMSQPDKDGINRWVVTKPRKIFTKQLTDEIVTYADFKELGRPGMIASRAQVI